MKTIQIKQEHIDKGKINSFSECPVALACQEQLGVDEDVQVSNIDLRVGLKDYELPVNARKFIEMYDAELPVKPFDMDISI